MYFVSTRGDEKATGAEAIVRGLAGDGGLFVPETFPEVSLGEIEQLVGMSYPERAAFVIGKYLGELGEDFLAEACKKAYSHRLCAALSGKGLQTFDAGGDH